MTAITPRPTQPTSPSPEVQPAVGQPAAGGDRFVAVALLLTAAVSFGFQLLAGELIPPILVFGLLYTAIGAVLLRRRPRWLLITVIVLVVAQVAGGIPFFIDNIAHPESPLSFLYEAFAFLAALTAAVGAIAGLPRAAPRSRRPLALAAFGLAAAAVVVSAVAAAGVDSETAQAGDMTVEVVGSHYPETLELPAGGAALWVDNLDPVRHTLVVEGTDIAAELPAATAVRVEADLAPGTYRFLCDVPGHERMAGELVAR